MRSILIDDGGQLNDSASPALRSRLNAWHVGNELAEYAIVNLGFVGLGGFDASPHIRLRPAVVSPVALAALLYWIADKAPQRVLLSTKADGWRHEMIGERVGIARKLARIVAAHRGDRAEDFLSRPTQINTLEAGNPLAILMELQSEFRDWMRPAEMTAMLDGALRGRYAMIGADASFENLVIDRVGPGYTTEGNYWFKRSLGHRLEDQPDQAYGVWLAEAYRAALRTGRAALDDVDVIVDWPNTGRVRYCYKRVLIPLSRQGDRVSVLSATLHDRRVDLRVKAG